ncbi:MAG: CHAT domain-containing tetratricopeptide repeat protein [Saprospiraceae bacterium]
MNRKIKTILIIGIAMLYTLQSRAQKISYEGGDSLSVFLEKKDWLSYFRKIKELSDSAYTNSDNQRLLEIGHILKTEFGELNGEERKALRETAMRVGNKIWKLTGNTREALSVYLIAHDNVNNKSTLDSLSWYVENEISNLYTMQGDYDKAEYFGNLLERSLKYFQLNKFLSRYYTNLGISLQSQNQIEKAIVVFKKGLNIADSIKYNNGIFSNALNLANIYNENPDLGSALFYLTKAGELLPMLASDKRYLEIKASYEFESANYKYTVGLFAESTSLYNEAISTLRKYYSNTERREFAKYYSSLAKVYVSVDSLAMANLTIHEGLKCLIPEYDAHDDMPNKNQLYPENSFMDLLSLYAKIYEREFTNLPGDANLEHAITCIEYALDVNDMIRETVIADPSKLVTIRNNKELITEGIEDLYKMMSIDTSHDYFIRARSLFNRSKSLLFDDKTRRNNIMKLITKQDKEIWASLQDSLEALYQKKYDINANINNINGQIFVCQEKIDRILSSCNYTSLLSRTPENYIEYFIADSDIYSLSEINGHRKFLKIGSKAKFDMLIERLNDYIYLKGLSLDETVLSDLYNFLIATVSDRLSSRVVIIPDGTIGYVPFEMLKDADGKYLIQNITISYSFEYTSYDDGIAGELKSLQVFCLAPHYKSKPESDKFISRGSIYDLPYAKMEADSIQKLFGNKAMVSQSCDKNELDGRLLNAHIFHYAGHAIIEGDAAYLALMDNGSESSQLTSNEIGIKHYALDLVVLSACETGLGKMEQGEGIRSLGRSFMESGAKSTVISLWNVNDKSTSQIMTGFYKWLLKGMRKDEALRQSKLDYLKNTSSRNRHPYFWAAFIPAGDMTPL